MQVHSFGYLFLFLPLVALGIHVLRVVGAKPRIVDWLLFTSIIFYLSADTAGFPVVMVSSTINWLIAQSILRSEGRTAKRFLVFGVTFNAAVLLAYKLVPVLSGQAGATDHATFSIPLGLSFVTIAQIMYLVDCREGLARSRGFRDHLAFTTFFPNVTAGPILRTKLFFKQVDGVGDGGSGRGHVTSAVVLISLGILKKLSLAESFSDLSDLGFSHFEDLSVPDSWLAVFANTFEVYFDFSGYSDIAVGSALLLGLQLSRNFNAPFRSQSISDFWRRWHISLSDFITTYLYTPILRGWGKPTREKAAVATLTAMVIAGIWHGFTWNFFFFGLCHGVALALYQYWKHYKRPLPALLSVGLTFAFVSVAFVSVRTSDFAQTITVMSGLFSLAGGFKVALAGEFLQSGEWAYRSVAVGIGMAVAFLGPTSDEVASRVGAKPWGAVVACVLAAAAIAVLGAENASEFRYRNF